MFFRLLIVLLTAYVLITSFMFYKSIDFNLLYGTPVIKQPRNTKALLNSTSTYIRTLGLNNSESQKEVSYAEMQRSVESPSSGTVRPTQNLTLNTSKKNTHEDVLKVSTQRRKLSLDFVSCPTYLIKPKYVCEGNGAGLKVLILVTSAPTHFKERQSIRYTWANFLRKKHVAMAFVIGYTNDKQTNEKMGLESKKNGDMLQGDFLDVYKNLTFKTMFLLRYFDESCSEATFLMKTDDDVFVNVENLLLELEKHTHKRLGIFGKVFSSTPVRNKKSKYYVGYDLFPGNQYPLFTSGTAYILTNKTALLLSQNSEGTKFFPLEDVLFTGILAEKLKIPRENVIAMQVDRTNYSLDKLITQHYLTRDDMFRIWKYLGTVREI